MMSSHNTWLAESDDRMRIDTGAMGGRFDVHVTQSGEIEIYTPDGSLEIHPKGDNSVRIRCVPTWTDKTAIEVAEHIIGEASPRAAAEAIINLLRGRLNKNKPHHE